MAAPQELDIWAEVLNTDGVTGTDQRRDLNLEEFRDGILKLVTPSSQQYNQMMFLLSSYSNPFYASPYLIPTTETIPSNALEVDGQTINVVDNPNLFAVYGSTLPNIVADAPTGFTFIVRNS